MEFYGCFNSVWNTFYMMDAIRAGIMSDSNFDLISNCCLQKNKRINGLLSFKLAVPGMLHGSTRSPLKALHNRI